MANDENRQSSYLFSKLTQNDMGQQQQQQQPISSNYQNDTNQNNNDLYINNEALVKIKKDVMEKLSMYYVGNNTNDIDQITKKQYILKVLEPYGLANNLKHNLANEIYNIMEGFGPIQCLIDDDDISEVIVMKYDKIYVERKGQLIKRLDIKFDSEEQLRALINKIVDPLGRRVDDSSPIVNARTAHGYRVNAVIPQISADGATLDIRKFTKEVWKGEEYIRLKSMTPDMLKFVQCAVISRMNIVVSGGTGSGKTTLLNVLSNYIPEDEAIVTIEDLLELKLVQDAVRRLEARPPNPEGKGAVTIRDLVVNSLRMRPDRIIVGECRSFEIIDMLQAMNTGHDGSLTTIHCNSPKDLISRIYSMCLMGADLPEKAVKIQITGAINLIVQTARLKNGERKITRISEIVGLGKTAMENCNSQVEKYKLDPKFTIKNPDNNEVYIQDIYRYDEINDKFIRTGWIPLAFETIRNFSAKCGIMLTEEDFIPTEYTF